jgi:hypothetical protein
MAEINLPTSLITAVQEQRAILFLGAGASFDAAHPKHAKIPLGDKLRDEISGKFLGGELKFRPLTAVAAMAASEVGLIAFQKYIRDLFIDFNPTDFHLLMPTFRWRTIVSTNFDLIVKRAYQKSRGARSGRRDSNPRPPTLARKLAVALDATVQPHPRPPIVSGEQGISG